VVLKKILESLINGTEMAGECPILFAAKGEEVINEWGEPVTGNKRGDAGLADFTQLQIEVRNELGIGFAGVGGGGRHRGLTHGV
jgi:hypothetical protein